MLTKAEFFALLRSLGRESYAAYLWSPVWLKIRRQVFKRAHRRCEDCGGKASQVHHLEYTEENVTGRGLRWMPRAPARPLTTSARSDPPPPASVMLWRRPQARPARPPCRPPACARRCEHNTPCQAALRQGGEGHQGPPTACADLDDHYPRLCTTGRAWRQRRWKVGGPRRGGRRAGALAAGRPSTRRRPSTQGQAVQVRQQSAESVEPLLKRGREEGTPCRIRRSGGWEA